MPFTRNNFISIAVAAAALASAGPAAAGDGTFDGGIEVAAETSPEAVGIGDFNEDGRPDFAYTHNSADNVNVHVGKASGGFETEKVAEAGSDPEQFVVADFNGDGHDDLAVADTGGKRIVLRLGKGDGYFQSTSLPADLPVGRTPGSLVAGDFNGDDAVDLAVANYSSAGTRISVYYGARNAEFRAPLNVDVPASALAAGDFNGDGIDDLAYGTERERGGLLLGSGIGTFSEGGTTTFPGTVISNDAIAVGDFDADGNEDVAFAVTRGGLVSVRFGDGTGKLAAGPDLITAFEPRSVATGDLDGDGDDDLVTVGGAVASVQLSDGKRAFTAAPDVPIKSGVADVALADFDRDGNDDLVAARQDQPGQGLSVRYGRGTPSLTGNLLVNGGFEEGAPERKLGTGKEIPGWVRSGQSTFLAYGTQSSSSGPEVLDSPRYGSGGSAYFSGGRSVDSDGVTGATQTVDVSARATAIDDGRATANLSAYLGGARKVKDAVSAQAEFLDANGTALGTLKIGPATPEDRKGLTRMVKRSGGAAVPAATRAIRVTLTAVDDDKTYSSATADNVKLTVAEREPTPGTGGEQPVTAFGTDTLVTVKRVGSKRKLRVRVTNANAFAVTGAIRGRGVKSKALQLAPGARRTVRLRLSKAKRHALARSGKARLRLRAVVQDPAGNTRTVKATVRIRKGRS